MFRHTTITLVCHLSALKCIVEKLWCPETSTDTKYAKAESAENPRFWF